VVERLKAAGHRVCAPTLAGLGERAAELSPAIGLHSHLEDVLQALDSMPSDRVVVGAHSYGGMLARGLVNIAVDRLEAVLYLDAYVPQSGQNGLDLRTPQANHDLWEELEKGWRVPPPDAKKFGLPEGELKTWVQERLTAMPVSCFRESFALQNTSLFRPRAAYLRTAWPNPSMDRHFHEFASLGLRAERWDCGHIAMLEKPEETFRLLEQVASDQISSTVT
jgi:pimeloyl-ACP methyl ester carboxylesterase